MSSNGEVPAFTAGKATAAPSLGSFEAAAFDSCKITVNITHVAANHGLLNVGCGHQAESMLVDDDGVFEDELPEEEDPEQEVVDNGVEEEETDDEAARPVKGADVEDDVESDSDDDDEDTIIDDEDEDDDCF